MDEDDNEANTISLQEATESQENSDIVHIQSSDDKKKLSNIIYVQKRIKKQEHEESVKGFLYEATPRSKLNQFMKGSDNPEVTATKRQNKKGLLKTRINISSP